jgi:hypothetical protein
LHQPARGLGHALGSELISSTYLLIWSAPAAISSMAAD